MQDTREYFNDDIKKLADGMPKRILKMHIEYHTRSKDEPFNGFFILFIEEEIKGKYNIIHKFRYETLDQCQNDFNNVDNQALYWMEASNSKT